MLILVEIKNNYGVKCVYPVNETGKLFAELSGKKTFSQNDIKIIKELGYTFEVKEQTL